MCDVCVCVCRYTGMLEAVRVRREGFAYRPFFSTFFSTYRSLAYYFTDQVSLYVREHCEHILTSDLPPLEPQRLWSGVPWDPDEGGAWGLEDGLISRVPTLLPSGEVAVIAQEFGGQSHSHSEDLSWLPYQENVSHFKELSLTAHNLS